MEKKEFIRKILDSNNNFIVITDKNFSSLFTKEERDYLLDNNIINTSKSPYYINWNIFDILADQERSFTKKNISNTFEFIELKNFIYNSFKEKNYKEIYQIKKVIDNVVSSIYTIDGSSYKELNEEELYNDNENKKVKKIKKLNDMDESEIKRILKEFEEDIYW